MDPGTMMLAATAAQAVASLAEGVGEYKQGRYDARVAEQNAQLARENASRARMDAARAEEAQRMQARKSLGRAAAAASQSGVAGAGPGQGSMGDMIKQASSEAELDALNIRYGGESEAHSHLIQEAQFKNERRAALQRARGGLMSGIFGSASAGLTGGSNYGRYTRETALRAPRPVSPSRATASRVVLP